MILDTKKLDQIMRDLPNEVSETVESWGWKITGDAIQMSPVDTGALRASLASESRMKDKFTFILQDGVEYGVFQELGTGRMAAHPFVVPSVMKNEKGFINAFKELLK